MLAIVLWTTFLVGDRALRKTMGWVLGISMAVVAPLGRLAGVVLGIVGLAREGRRWSLIGTVLNGLFILGAILLLLVGLSGIAAH